MIAGMPRAQLSIGIELEYDTFGDPADPALILVMGLGTQMVAWHPRFCGMLADHGLFVVRFDNRDCGLSTRLEDVPVDVVGALQAAVLGEPVTSPYTLSHLADDVAGLLDYLELDSGPRSGGVPRGHDRPDVRHRAPRADHDPHLDHVVTRPDGLLRSLP